jgi:putative chitinase
MDAIDYLPAALFAVAPDILGRADWEAALAAPMRAAELTTARRCAMFLGQCAEESGGFSVLAENLDYSARRIMEVWPQRFLTLDIASLYERRPAALGNHVYADRLGNGDEGSGDGYQFRGGGLIQLTGRTYWTRFGASVHRSAEDAWDWAQTPAGAAASACWYWVDRVGLRTLSDGWQITETTRRINGGLTNLQLRITLCNAALRAIGVTTAHVGQTGIASAPPVTKPADVTKSVTPPSDDPDTDALNAAEQARIKRGDTSTGPITADELERIRGQT